MTRGVAPPSLNARNHTQLTQQTLLGEGVFEVKATNGDTYLGGDDFEQRIVDWIADEFRKGQGIDCQWPQAPVNVEKQPVSFFRS